MHRVLCACVVVLTAFLVAAGWYGSASAAKSSDSAKQTAPKSGKATENSAKAAEEIDVDLSLGIYQKQRTLSLPGMEPIKPANGMFMVAIVKIHNKGSQPCTLKPAMLVIRDDKGKAYPLHKDFGLGFFEKPLAPGAIIEEKTVFDIPAAAKSLALRFEANGKTLAEIALGDRSDDEFSRMFLATPDDPVQSPSGAPDAPAAPGSAPGIVTPSTTGFPINVFLGNFTVNITAMSKGKSIQNAMGEWLQAQNGTYVTVDLTLMNNDVGDSTVPSGLFILQDKAKKSYTPIAPISSPQLLSGAVPAAGQFAGRLVFEVPLNAKKLELKVKAEREAVVALP